MIIMRAALPQNKFIALDPLAMAERDYDHHVTRHNQTSDNTTETSDLERDAFTSASPFCNPDF